jgi:glucan phosphoethanolaminetransferase (alkaline phosphatase superfamily)
MKNKKWLQIMGLAMSLPSTIFLVAWGAFQLVKLGLITKVVAIFIFLAAVGSILFLMVYYAYKRKN